MSSARRYNWFPSLRWLFFSIVSCPLNFYSVGLGAPHLCLSDVKCFSHEQGIKRHSWWELGPWFLGVCGLASGPHCCSSVIWRASLTMGLWGSLRLCSPPQPGPPHVYIDTLTYIHGNTGILAQRDPRTQPLPVFIFHFLRGYIYIEREGNIARDWETPVALFHCLWSSPFAGGDWELEPESLLTVKCVF